MPDGKYFKEAVMKISLSDRFWSKVDKLSEDGCWEWTGFLMNTGYGGFHSVHGELVLSHRQSWILTNGDIPEGMKVLHRCDNRKCVNPTHLFLGTDSDNVADMVAKNRQARGETQGHAKLTTAQVLQIRHYYKCGNSQKVIAQLFDVDKATIGEIVRREIWKHVR